MKITIEIGEKDYTFEMNRFAYKRLLNDKEYAQMQNELSRRAKEKVEKEKALGKDKNKLAKELQEDMNNDEVTEILLRNMIYEEQVFSYSLCINHPKLSKEEKIALLEVAYEEYGSEAVANLCSKLMENFIPKGDKPKKEMVMRMD